MINGPQTILGVLFWIPKAKMGNLLARRPNLGLDEYDQTGSGNAYFYPPKLGNYFSTHFIMGGERFETSQPEAYLFGENMDLNFLGGKPTPFPYSAPLPHEPTRTLRALINIRKESLRLIKVPIEAKHLPNGEKGECQEHEIRALPRDSQKDKFKYNIEFIFDTDVQCAITVYYMCTEEITASGLLFTPKDRTKTSETYLFKKGANQQFNQSSHIFDPSSFDEDDLMYRAFDEHGNFDVGIPFPIVIHCVAQEGDEPRQSHALIAVVEKNGDGTFSIKPFKQKIFIDGLCYLFQEIYGIENKSATVSKSSNYSQMSPDDDVEDNSSECVICMSDSRDTLILPCRHLCLCYACADSLRYQANNCPICRSPFRALLQIRAVRKSGFSGAASTLPSVLPHHQLCTSGPELVDIPPGFEPVSLLEALNGTSVNLSGSHGMYCFRSISDEESVRTPLTGASYKRIRIPKNIERPYCDTKDVTRDDSCFRGQRRPRQLSNSAGSSGSSNASEVATNGVPQECVRLLCHQPEDEREIVEMQFKNVFMGRKSKSGSSLLNENASGITADMSPASGDMSSESFPILSLGDGIDEQKYMTETDLLSVTTRGSSPNIIARDDIQTPDNCMTFGNKMFMMKPAPGMAKLAEHEKTDDLDD